MQKKTIPFYKNSLLVITVLLGTSFNTFGYDIRSTAKLWLPTPIYTALKKYVFLQKGHERIQKKYAKEKHKNIIENPTDSAQAFKKAIQKNTAINQQLKNNPKLFLLGASSSSYQVEGNLDKLNATAQFNDQRNLPMAGEAIDFWDRYKTDIPQMKTDLGINAFRISIAWERVQPTKKTWDEEAISKYVDIIKTLKSHDIEPIVVLHHYTIPTWFAEINGFEKKENNKHFVEFAKKMYEALSENVTYWSTFNAIEGYAFKSYHLADNAPGKKGDLQMAISVMANMLESHVQIYQAIKKSYNQKCLIEHHWTIPNPQIGLQKNIAPLDVLNETWQHTLQWPKSKIFTFMGEVAQNKGFYNFFNTGIFYTWLPTKAYVKTAHNPDAQKSLDWIGVNTYSNMYMLGSERQPEENAERKTENINYRDYPEGIYRAVEAIHKNIAQPLNIPIFITENGIATKNDVDGNKKRTRFFQRTLFTIRKLLEEGYNVIGYTPWSCHDNYEWPSVDQPDPWNSRRYGFFYVNFDKTSPDYLQRTLKEGSHFYRDFLKDFFS